MSISHVVLGVSAILAPPDTVTRLAATFYGATLTVTPPMHHVLRILGAFMIAVGVMAALAAFNPMMHRGIITGVVVLLLLRVAQRLIFAREIQSAFGVSSVHLWGQSAFFLLFALGLLALRSRNPSS